MKIAMPCLDVKLVKREDVVANNYNPNAVSPDKMDLLRQSIVDNGFCFPIVTIWDADLSKYVIIDGFHRFTMCQPEWLDLEEVPVVVLEHDITKRLIATVQFNKARGVHQVDLDADLIRSLIEQGLAEEEISAHLGIDLDTVHRYKQVSGVAALFANATFSTSWSMVDDAG
jgi:ParB-like chromosome segregation protein Spo0J